MAAIWADVVAELPVGMLLGDENGAVLAHNARAGELLGLTANQLRTGTLPAQWRACAENGAEPPRPEDLIGQLARTVRRPRWRFGSARWRGRPGCGPGAIRSAGRASG
jgi:PAS domain-containing protein